MPWGWDTACPRSGGSRDGPAHRSSTGRTPAPRPHDAGCEAGSARIEVTVKHRYPISDSDIESRAYSGVSRRVKQGGPQFEPASAYALFTRRITNSLSSDRAVRVRSATAFCASRSRSRGTQSGIRSKPAPKRERLSVRPARNRTSERTPPPSSSGRYACGTSRIAPRDPGPHSCRRWPSPCPCSAGATATDRINTPSSYTSSAATPTPPRSSVRPPAVSRCSRRPSSGSRFAEIRPAIASASPGRALSIVIAIASPVRGRRLAAGGSGSPLQERAGSSRFASPGGRRPSAPGRHGSGRGGPASLIAPSTGSASVAMR
jgi:hypothetical protein